MDQKICRKCLKKNMIFRQFSSLDYSTDSMHEGRIGIVCWTYLTIKSSDYPLPVCALTTTYRTNNIVLPETNLITTMDGKSTFLVTTYRDQILEKKWLKNHEDRSRHRQSYLLHILFEELYICKR